jgi:hypothetical protein
MYSYYPNLNKFYTCAGKLLRQWVEKLVLGRDGGRTNVEHSVKAKVKFILERATNVKRGNRYISLRCAQGVGGEA